MKFTLARCPQCGAEPRGTVEELQGLALLMSDGVGGYEYAGETEVWWDSQKSLLDGSQSGRPLLVCPEGHQWWAAKEGDQVEHTPTD